MSILCRHRTQTTPRRDEKGEYRRCLDCGIRLSWSWPDDFPIGPPRQAHSRAELTLGRTTTVVWEVSRKSA